MFDESGMRAVLSDLARRGTARETTEGIIQNILEFTGGVYEDDMTIVAVRRAAAAAETTNSDATGTGTAGTDATGAGEA
jgi:hypothetical protein